MANTLKKVQQLQKNGAGILASFKQAETALSKQMEASESLKAEIAQEIKQQQSLLEQVNKDAEETKTVLQNVRDFLGLQ